jgi:hypothetical protein
MGQRRPWGDVARLRAHNRRPLQLSERALDRGRIHPTLGIGADPDRRLATEAEQSQRPVDRDVRLLAADDVDPRRTRQSVTLDIPAGAREHGVASGGEARRVRSLAARDEADARARRQAHELQRPIRGDLLYRSGRGGKRVEASALIPRRDQPVRGERCRQRAADHETEVPRAGRRDDPRVGARHERVDHRRGILAVLRQRPAQRGADLGRVRGSRHRALADALQEALRVCGRRAQRSLAFIHARDPKGRRGRRLEHAEGSVLRVGDDRRGPPQVARDTSGRPPSRSATRASSLALSTPKNGSQLGGMPRSSAPSARMPPLRRPARRSSCNRSCGGSSGGAAAGLLSVRVGSSSNDAATEIRLLRERYRRVRGA